MMGAYASNFLSDTEGSVASFTNPNEANWITAHAVATELAIPEVERLWSRFQQLGCDGYGLLSITEPLPTQITQDAFIRNILKSMKGVDGKVTFQSFLTALKWIECESIDKKIRATFHLLNNGQAIDKALLKKILKRVYSDDSDKIERTLEIITKHLFQIFGAAISRLADVFFSEMDPDRKGVISEEEFVSWVKRMPQETINQLMEFHILPSDISQEAQEQLSEFRNSESMGSRYGVSTAGQKDSPSDMSESLLDKVAEKICRRDWVLVGNKLGLLQQDLDYVMNKFDGNPKQQAYQMLLDWKRKSGTEARKDMLDKALRSSSMADVALLISVE